MAAATGGRRLRSESDTPCTSTSFSFTPPSPSASWRSPPARPIVSGDLGVLLHPSLNRVGRRPPRPDAKEDEMQSTTPSRSISTMWFVALVMAAGLAVGCARSPGVPSGAAGADGTVRSHLLGEDTALSDDSADADYDPWQSFNEHMFSFNHDVLDGWLLKPAAKGWAKIFP